MSDPTIPDSPITLPDAPSPNAPADLPDIGELETEPDQPSNSLSA